MPGSSSPPPTTASAAKRGSRPSSTTSIEALRWLHRNAGDCAVDADRIYLWGASAGGHLAALAALRGDVPTVRGVVCWYPVTDLLALDQDATDSFEAGLLGGPIGANRELAVAASPVHHVHADAPAVPPPARRRRHVGAVRSERPARGSPPRALASRSSWRSSLAPTTSSTGRPTSRRSSPAPSTSCSPSTTGLVSGASSNLHRQLTNPGSGTQGDIDVTTTDAVVFPAPDEIEGYWALDKMHAPRPITPLSFDLVVRTLAEGFTKAQAEYDCPIMVSTQGDQPLLLRRLPSDPRRGGDPAADGRVPREARQQGAADRQDVGGGVEAGGDRPEHPAEDRRLVAA